MSNQWSGSTKELRKELSLVGRVRPLVNAQRIAAFQSADKWNEFNTCIHLSR